MHPTLYPKSKGGTHLKLIPVGGGGGGGGGRGFCGESLRASGVLVVQPEVFDNFGGEGRGGGEDTIFLAESAIFYPYTLHGAIFGLCFCSLILWPRKV